MKKYTLFVATNGNDKNKGTIDSPLATITEANKRARKYRYDHQIIINVRGGDYYPDRTTFFGADDGGIDERYPTICQSYRNERVTFHGGRRIPNEKISRVTDEAVLSRIIDKKARKKVLQVDLSDYSDYLMREHDRHAYHRRNFPIELYMNGKAMELARWPKRCDDPSVWGPYTFTKGYKTAKNGDRFIYLENEAVERMKMWHPSSYSELFVEGYFSVEWTCSTERARSVNIDRGYVRTRGKIHSYNPEDGDNRRRVFISNVLDELSKPGEYYIDYDKEIMYFIPEKSIEKTEIIFPTLDETMFYFGMSVMNLVFRNINTAYTRGRVIDIVELNGPSWGPVTIEGCEFAHGTQRAITLRRAFKVNIKNCKIYDFGFGGINAECCGQRGDLRSAEILIEGCEMHDTTRINHCYTGCINLGYETCGFTIRGNKFYNSPHYLIGLSCIDSVVENNEFFNAVRDCDDASVIYWGRDAACLGLVIRNNYFHDWGNDFATWGVAGIYTDDGAVGADIYNNVFENHAQSENGQFICVKASGESFSHIHNNVFLTRGVYHRIGTWDNVRNTGITGWLPPILGIYAKSSWVKRFDHLSYDGYFSHIWRDRFKGTNWERMWSIVNAETCAKYQNRLNEYVNSGMERETACYKLMVEIYADFWNHKFPDGTVYEGDLVECMKTVFKELYDKAMGEIDSSSEYEVLKREELLVRELYFFGHLVPEHTVETHGNICVATHPHHIADNGKVKLGFYQAKTELLLEDETVNGEPLFKDRRTFAMSDGAIAYIKEKLPEFVPFELDLMK